MERNLRARIAGVVAALLLAAAIVAGIGMGLARAQEKLPQKFTMEFTAQDIAVLSTALGLRPYNEVADLLRRMNAQLDAQVKAANTPAPETPALESK